MDLTSTYVFRAWFGQALTVVIAAICALSVVAFTVQQGIGAGLRWAPLMGLFAGACWAVFWRPCVVVDAAGVQLVNILRTVTVPWPSLLAIDTKWALTLVTVYGSFRAWAAPAPGAAHVVRSGKIDRREAAGLPASTFGPDGIRVGDLPSSPSGGAALVIRERWDALRKAGHLEEPKLEFERAPVQWHWRVVGGATVLVIASALAVVV